MENKKYLKLIVLGLLCLFTFSSTSVFAENTVGGKNLESKVTVGIGDIKKKEVKPGIYKPEVDPSVKKLLPKTNEVINVLLILLGLICIFVVFLGLVMFKKTYDENYYAFV